MPSRSSAAQALTLSLNSKSRSSSSSSSSDCVIGSEGGVANNRQPRVIFNAFNLEEVSDDVAKDQVGGGYDAAKMPVKVACDAFVA